MREKVVKLIYKKAFNEGFKGGLSVGFCAGILLCNVIVRL